MSEPSEASRASSVRPEAHNGGALMRGLRRVGGGLKTSLALVGLASATGFYLEYRKHQKSTDNSSEQKKRVLYIPFNRLQLVEKREKSFGSAMEQLLGNYPEDKPLKMEVRELVDIIHHASSDPSIVALYGQFGHGSTLPQAGWADLEEVRNALKVFRESHRHHADPNLSHRAQVIPKVQCKPIFAYADSFASLGDPANKEYYLASICTSIHLQNSGELNLFGVMSQNFFLRRLLEKYGVGLHVFKHGEYKNAPNMFTETGFNRAHHENVRNVVDMIDQSVCRDISRSRSTALLTSWLKLGKKMEDDQKLWKRIHESGTFPAETAWKAGLVDYLPRRSPLEDLIGSKDDDERKKNWEVQETDFALFNAEKAVSLSSYAREVNKTKGKQDGSFLDTYASRSSGLGNMLTMAGIASDKETENDKEESIALLRIDEGIMDATANKLVRSIRKISKDKSTKAVVLRVNSPGGSITACETISQELRALKVPVIVSFGNVSASGGYYVSSFADRIFASQKTITGSVGVFGIRLDLTGLASKYGINVEHVTSGDLAAAVDPFHPMTRRMKENFGGSIDRCYKQFKKVVSEGRGMSMDEVETYAQGRVWTGEQAKANGLIDEIGGLHRALAYTQRMYTTSGDARIKEFPNEALWDRLRAIRDGSDAREFLVDARDWFFGRAGNDGSDQRLLGLSLVSWLLQDAPRGLPGTMAGVLLASDENAAIELLLKDAKKARASTPLLPPDFWN